MGVVTIEASSAADMLVSFLCAGLIGSLQPIGKHGGRLYGVRCSLFSVLCSLFFVLVTAREAQIRSDQPTFAAPASTGGSICQTRQTPLIDRQQARSPRIT